MQVPFGPNAWRGKTTRVANETNENRWWNQSAGKGIEARDIESTGRGFRREEYFYSSDFVFSSESELFFCRLCFLRLATVSSANQT